MQANESGVVLAGALALWACASHDAQPRASEQEASNVFEAQAALGATLFARHCADCHGESGEGGEGPRLVGLDQGALPRDPPPSRALRRNEFVTAADVAEFVVANMPPDQAGSLTLDEYLAILAFDLQANGITLEEELTLDLASSLTIPR